MALLRTNTGIGTTNPTSALHVIGDVLVTGVVTSVTFNGQINAGVSTLGLSTAGSFFANQLSVSGVSTFTGIATNTSTLFANQLSVSGISTFTTLNDGIGNVRSIPQNSVGVAYTLTVTDVGKHVAISTGGITVPPSVFSIGDNVTLFNNSDYNQMITPGSGVTLRRAGVGDTGSRGLNGYGLATILCIASNSFVITGAGLT